MAKFFLSEKWKTRAVTALTLALSATVALGALTACSKTADEDETEDDTSTSVTDTQVIKNGDFEFYTEKETDEIDDKRVFFNSPTSWSLSTSSTSNTRSGIINTDEWDYITKSSATSGTRFTSKDDALKNWNEDDVTLYDRLQFYDEYDVDSKDDFSLYTDYKYTPDFEDVEFLRKELGDSIKLHDEDAQREEGDTSVLMIHNRRTSDNVVGTAQYYTSSSSITVKAGTAVKVSVWVKTAQLYHYYANASTADEPATLVKEGAGAYIGVTHSVGGKSLKQMQVKNINTASVESNNGWAQYTMYLRANTYATSTFNLVLGLGQGSSDSRYEYVNGYALFDDVECTTITNEAYETATSAASVGKCDLMSNAEDKLFDVSRGAKDYTAFALDLSTVTSETPLVLSNATVDFGLTEEVSGSATYTSETKWDLPLNATSVTKVFDDVTTIKDDANAYLKEFGATDFANYPFDNKTGILLFSQNGAAITAKLPTYTLAANTNKLISFYVKTSEMISGVSGASATIVDGSTRTTIAAFDSTTIDTVDVDDDNEDIYDGWVHCMFLVKNETDEDKTFNVELHYGPTAITGATASSFGQGYAAFANVSEISDLNATLTGYVSGSTGDRMKSVSLTASVKDETKFDSILATSKQAFENGEFGKTATFDGVVAGSRTIGGQNDNVVPADVFTGLVNKEYADKYYTNDTLTIQASLLTAVGGSATTGAEWWTAVFGNGAKATPVATQPLLIFNNGATATASYGYKAATTTVAASSYQKISMRVKTNGAAYIYLLDMAEDKTKSGEALTTNLPVNTYWYDDEGNICKADPSADTFNAKTDVLFVLGENGLYTNATDKTDTKVYANLSAYQQFNGNLVTKDETIAFYGNDGKYYAYRTGDEDNYEYKTEVTALPTEVGGTNILRYSAPANTAKTSVIKVEDTQGEWVEVAFYVHTGNEAKSYRVEVWAGDRTNVTDGLAAGKYVFFDNFSSADVSSSYEAVLAETVEQAKDANGVADEDNLPDTIATYYTYTYYDSANYLRFDETEDEDGFNPYGGYTQSTQTEKLVYLQYSGDWTGRKTSSVFIDYSASDHMPTAESAPSTDTDDDDDSDDTASDDGLNIWLVLSSVLLAGVLVFAVGAIFVRKWLKKRTKRKGGKVENKGAKRAKLKIVEKDEDEE